MKIKILESCLVVLVCTIFFVGCTSSPRVFQAKGSSTLITGAENDIPNINEGLSAQDYHLLINASLKSLDRKCPAPLKRVPVMISNFENQTASDLDVQLLRRELGDALAANGYTTVDKFSREDLANELSYEELGYTDRTLATVKGRQVSTRYLVRTVINSRSEAGASDQDQKFTRYHLSLQFVNSETAEIEPGCVGSAEIRKDYWRERTAF